MDLDSTTPQIEITAKLVDVDAGSDCTASASSGTRTAPVDSAQFFTDPDRHAAARGR